MSAPYDSQVVERALAALGRKLSPETLEATQAIYAPYHPTSADDERRITRDARYGAHERHRLDIGRPVDGAARPALIFVHGGGFVAGDKRRAGGPFYDNILTWASRHGFVGVNMTYRLAPAHPWPAGAEDVAAAVAWLRDHADEHGVDPARIFVMGQSAGAAHVATYLARYEESARLAGAILVSGVYDLTQADPRAVSSAYYGDDAGLFAERSSAAGVAARDTPLLVAIAENDPPHFERQTLALLEAVHLRARRLPRVVQLLGHNHLSSVLHLGLPDDQLGDAILRFARDPRRGAAP